MIKRGMKRGFTLVELLIVVAIIALLSGAAYIGIQRSQARGMNERMADDLNAIVSALEQYKQDKGHYPNMAVDEGSIVLGKDKNVLCFNADTTYSHKCEDAEFIQTQVDNNLLTKRYLQEVPTDPRTGSRYSYGVTTDGLYFQVAGDILDEEDGTYTAKVVGNVDKGYSMPSLIRAYDGPNFVMDGEGYLPYSPDHLAVTAKLYDLTGTPPDVKVDGNNAGEGDVVKPGSVITTGPGSTVALYFSDGSITYLDEKTTLTISPKASVDQNNKDGIITKIRLKLTSGKIWSKVARLAAASEFNVQTTTAIAGVRGTEFGISAETVNALNPELVVLSGKVAARRIQEADYPTLGTSDYIDFSTLNNTFFSTGQVTAEGSGLTFVSYVVPDVSGTMPAGSADATYGSGIKAKFYKTVFNNNYRPRILDVDGATTRMTFRLPDGVVIKKIIAVNAIGQEMVIDSLAIVFNTSEHKMSINTDSLGNLGPVKFRFEDANGKLTAFSDPLVDVGHGATLTEAEIYNMMAGDEPQPNCGNPIMVQVNLTSTPLVGGENVQTSALAVYSDPTCNKDISTECAWSITPSYYGTFDPIIKNKLTLNPIADGVGSVNCQEQSGQTGSSNIWILSRFHFVCIGDDRTPNTSDDNGDWNASEKACWVLGDSGQSCDLVCPDKLKFGINSIGKCVDKSDGLPEDWDDTPSNAICMELTGLIQPPLNPPVQPKGDAGDNAVFAPYLSTGFYNRCWSRPLAAISSDFCGTTLNMAGEQRVCRCVEL